MARRAPVALIFRRGPPNYTQLVRWDTKTDKFSHGQWFKGRVYERRCDLSPSGDKLIYFAAKHHLRRGDASFKGSWTAISKVPYFTALTLFPNGGTYHGGGLFAADDTVLLNSVHYRWSNPKRDEPATAHASYPVPPDLKIKALCFTSGEQLFLLRLTRDHWKLVTPGDVNEDGAVTSGTLVRRPDRQRFELQLDFAPQTLMYRLLNAATKQVEDPMESVTWADWDQQGRLVIADHGKLFAIGPGLERKLLADFNDRTPRRLPPPEQALA